MAIGAYRKGVEIAILESIKGYLRISGRPRFLARSSALRWRALRISWPTVSSGGISVSG